MLMRAEKIRFFELKMTDFFRKAGREHLPWRKKNISGYEVWVSEVMLQQTQVSRVIPYYEKFLARFPDVSALALASWEEFLPFYAGLGYYARGRNMLRAAKLVVERYRGKFPEEREVLQMLPGVGTYTASAIASFAYGAEILAWDTNVRRVMGRFFFGTKNFEDTLEAGVSKGRETLSKIESWKLKIEKSFSLPAREMNAALMDLGSALCTGKPRCNACPLREKCLYFREKGTRELIVKNQKSIEKRSRQSTVEKVSRKRKNIWKEARVLVTLHENHQKYFSSTKESYQPFVIPPSYNTRAGIKEWFRLQYGLEVSVRPPEKKVSIRGVLTLLVNAQILSGKHSFVEFPKSVRNE